MKKERKKYGSCRIKHPLVKEKQQYGKSSDLLQNLKTVYRNCLAHATEIKKLGDLRNRITTSRSQGSGKKRLSHWALGRIAGRTLSPHSLFPGPLLSQLLPGPFIPLKLSSELQTQPCSYLLEITHICCGNLNVNKFKMESFIPIPPKPPAPVPFSFSPLQKSTCFRSSAHPNSLII